MDSSHLLRRLLAGRRTACVAGLCGAVFTTVLACASARKPPEVSQVSITSADAPPRTEVVSPLVTAGMSSAALVTSPQRQEARPDAGAALAQPDDLRTWGAPRGGYASSSTSMSAGPPAAPTVSSEAPVAPTASTEDLEISDRIRRTLRADDSLSVVAKNVAVITMSGRVTLRGAVRSEVEKGRVEWYAKDAAGSTNVESLLTVVPK